MRKLLSGLPLILFLSIVNAERDLCVLGYPGIYKVKIDNQILRLEHQPNQEQKVIFEDKSKRVTIFSNRQGAYRILGESLSGNYCFEVYQWKNGFSEKIESKLLEECPTKTRRPKFDISNLEIDNSIANKKEILVLLSKQIKARKYFLDYSISLSEDSSYLHPNITKLK